MSFHSYAVVCLHHKTMSAPSPWWFFKGLKILLSFIKGEGFI